MEYEINLDTIVEHLQTMGVAAYVEQTGGGTATIYAGTNNVVAAGPGWFAGPRWTNGRGNLFDFVVGPNDEEDVDPDGYIVPADVGAFTEVDIAKLIAAQANKPDPRVALSTDEVEELGFDGTARSRPAEMIAEDKRARVRMDAHNAENKRLLDLGVGQWERMPLAEAAGERALAEYDAQRES